LTHSPLARLKPVGDNPLSKLRTKFMKRYAVCHVSFVTDAPLVISETDSPAEAYKGALKAQKDGLKDVRVADTKKVTSHDPQSFAAMHRL
jgi:hypothetical protein